MTQPSLERHAIYNEQLRQQPTAVLAKNSKLETEQADFKRKRKAVADHMNIEASKMGGTTTENVKMEGVVQNTVSNKTRTGTHTHSIPPTTTARPRFQPSFLSQTYSTTIAPATSVCPPLPASLPINRPPGNNYHFVSQHWRKDPEKKY
ncbi:hypothetical protein BDZ45DRAFT_672306 [Acephala macrosclerotiorum]|nr:hypothetical protein BDZ45DRAFT_672306 [Acephala macrosclerotiorum]